MENQLSMLHRPSHDRVMHCGLRSLVASLTIKTDSIMMASQALVAFLFESVMHRAGHTKISDQNPLNQIGLAADSSG